MYKNASEIGADLLIAVDVGNSGVKFGVFRIDTVDRFFPFRVWKNDPSVVSDFFTDDVRLQWFVSSVNSSNMRKVTDWVAENRPNDTILHVDRNMIPMISDVDNPMCVGIDRLLGALGAVSWIKNENTSSKDSLASERVVVCDFGTAITIDLASLEGFYYGGVILPGFELAATVLADKTELLPNVDVFGVQNLTYPARNTESSIAAGIYWGTVGAIRQFVELSQKKIIGKGCEFIKEVGEVGSATNNSNVIFQSGNTNCAPAVLENRNTTPFIVLTGFGSARIANDLRAYFPEDRVFGVDNLVLSGIRITSEAIP